MARADVAAIPTVRARCESPRRSPGLSDEKSISPVRMPIAGLLAWLVPGLGHLYLGLRGRGAVCLVTITATFWTGVAIGGVQGTVDPKERKLWFIAQLCSAANTLAAYGLSRSNARELAREGQAPPVAHWASADVGVHYTGVAGLLNLLVILDAISRAEALPAAKKRRTARARGVP